MGAFGRRTIAVIMSVIMVLSCFAGMTFSVGADSYGDFRYDELDDGTIEIKSYYGKAEEITVPGNIYGKTVTSIGGFAFSDNDTVKKITLPDSLTNIGSGAFSDCTNLDNIIIPDGVETLGTSVFEKCTSLKDITIPDNITILGHSLFEDCTSLATVSFSDKVTKIEYSAFENCGKLKSIKLPGSLESIDSNAFYGCESLEKINIPAGVTEIGAGCFSLCHSLEEFTVDSANESFIVVDGVLFDKDIATLIAFPGAYVGDYTIPDGVQVVKNAAFAGADELTSLFIPKDVYSLYFGIFSQCKKLKEVTVDSNNRYYKSMDDVLFEKNSPTLYSCPNAKQGEYVIPDGIKTIYFDAFSGCSMLTGIKIPDAVTEIYSQAFYNCENLKSITIPDGVEIIPVSAFENCKSLTEAKIGKNVTSIKNSAFKNCSSLTDINIPDGVETIESDCFYNCAELTSVTIPNSVTEINYDTFFGCRKLTSVTIPDSVTKIYGSAFRGCSNLKNVVIPNSVTEIGYNAFGFDYKDDDIYDYFKMDDFTIYGTEGSAAQKYAEDNGLNFAVYTGCIHTNTEIRNEKTATCTESGYSGDVYCKDCGAFVKKGTETDKAEHKFVNGKCTVCGASDNNSKPTEKPTGGTTENPNNKPTEPNTKNPNNKPTEKTTEPSTSAGGKLSFADKSSVKGKIDNSNNTVLIYPDGAAGISIDEFKALFNGNINVDSAGKSIVFSGMKFTFAGDEYTFILKGDTDCNGKITASDARIALRHAARLENIDDSILPAAEVDEDGRVTAKDARIILRYAAKLISQMDGADKIVDTSGGSESEKTTAEKPTTTTQPVSEVTKPTEKPTEPTTKTEEPTTEPTTETEELTTEPTTEGKKVNPELPECVRSLFKDSYDLSGYVGTDEKKTIVRYVCDSGRFFFTDGSGLGMLRLTVNPSGKNGSFIYYVNESNKSYCYISKTLMEDLGISEEDIENMFSVPDTIDSYEYRTDIVTFNGVSGIMRYMFTGNESSMAVYVDNGSIVGIEFLDGELKSVNTIYVDSFSSSIDESRFSLDDYEEKSLKDFANDIPNVPTPDDKTNKALSPESAVDIYLSQKDVWMAYPEFYPMNGYSYGFLDLDFDGTLELIRNINDGSGRYSSNAYFKINMTDYSVYELKYVSEDAHEGYDYSFSDEHPKLLKSKADGSLIYYCYDFMRVMTGDYANYYGTLNMTADGCIDSKLLFGEHHQEAGLYKNPNAVDEYFIYKDNMPTDISKSQYDEEIASYFDTMEDVELTWSLIPGKELETAVYSKQKELLLDSYNQFGYKDFSFENYDLINP